MHKKRAFSQKLEREERGIRVDSFLNLNSIPILMGYDNFRVFLTFSETPSQGLKILDFISVSCKKSGFLGEFCYKIHT